jgi:hypothetical protein
VACDTGQHSWTDLVAIVKRKDKISPAIPRKDFMRAALTLNPPADSKERGRSEGGRAAEIDVAARQGRHSRNWTDLADIAAHEDMYDFFHDGYQPGELAFESAFSLEEKQCLVEIHRRLHSCWLDQVGCMADLWRQSEWMAVMQAAQQASQVFAQHANNP